MYLRHKQILFLQFKFVCFQITVVVANYTGTQETGREVELDNADRCRCADRVKNWVLSVVVRKVKCMNWCMYIYIERAENFVLFKCCNKILYWIKNTGWII